MGYPTKRVKVRRHNYKLTLRAKVVLGGFALSSFGTVDVRTGKHGRHYEAQYHGHRLFVGRPNEWSVLDQCMRMLLERQ